MAGLTVYEMRTRSPPEEKQRACVRCRKMFASSWAGHRVCPECEEREGDLRVPVVYRRADE